MSLTLAQLEQFLSDLVADSEHWCHLVRDASDARVYEQIWDDEHVNAWVICWSEDQDTGYHDHDTSGAAVAVVSGCVREDRFRIGAPPRSRSAVAGETFTVPADAIHRVMHEGDVQAITIHAYSPPLARTGVYRTGEDGVLRRESMSYEEELRGDPVLTP
jgi:predicted metal-dependent enzyme (double-stranded beta helix superfamily)